MKKTAHNKITTLPELEICAKYISGNSENRLSIDFGVSRSVIKRVLISNGINRRGQSDAESLKWSQMTPQQRKNQVEACHKSVVGKNKSPEHRAKIAISRERNTPLHYIGVGEPEFKSMLTENKIDFSYQKAILGYNMDFFILGVDVELTAFTGRNSIRRRAPINRAKRIFKHGKIHTLAVEIRSSDDIAEFYHEIIGTILELSKVETSECNFWIARCTSNGYSVERLVIKN